ncbi:hypothetical protein EV714DRAFT_240433 [Schizophyllum commune]
MAGQLKGAGSAASAPSVRVDLVVDRCRRPTGGIADIGRGGEGRREEGSATEPTGAICVTPRASPLHGVFARTLDAAASASISDQPRLAVDDCHSSTRLDADIGRGWRGTGAVTAKLTVSAMIGLVGSRLPFFLRMHGIKGVHRAGEHSWRSEGRGPYPFASLCHSSRLFAMHARHDTMRHDRIYFICAEALYICGNLG